MNVSTFQIFAHHLADDGAPRATSRRIVRGVPQELNEPWWNIVGVAEDFPAKIATHTAQPKVYLALRPAETFPITLAVRAPGLAPSVAADRMRNAALEVDPTLRLGAIRSLEDRLEEGIRAERLGILAIVAVMGSVVLLSAVGIYALMSFTVTRRRREIGIRSALGTGSGRVLAEILSSALRQIGTGIAIGVAGAPIIATLAGNTSTPKELIADLIANPSYPSTFSIIDISERTRWWQYARRACATSGKVRVPRAPEKDTRGECRDCCSTCRTPSNTS
jgi:hypothetical protein